MGVVWRKSKTPLEARAADTDVTESNCNGYIQPLAVYKVTGAGVYSRDVESDGAVTVTVQVEIRICKVFGIAIR